jgi:hypothetical protein
MSDDRPEAADPGSPLAGGPPRGENPGDADTDVLSGAGNLGDAEGLPGVSSPRDAEGFPGFRDPRDAGELPGVGYQGDTGADDDESEMLASGPGRHRALRPHRWVGMPPKWIVPAVALIAVAAFIIVAVWAFRDDPTGGAGRNAADLPGVLPFDPGSGGEGTPGPLPTVVPPTSPSGTAPTPTRTVTLPTPSRLPSPVPLIPPPGSPTPSAVVPTVVVTAPTTAGSPTSGPEPEGFTAAVRVENWGSGYNTYVTVRNVGTAAATWGIRIVVDTGETVSAVWNATQTSATGETYTFGSNSGSLAAGASYTFGFQVGGTATDGPVSCAVVGGSGCVPG